MNTLRSVRWMLLRPLCLVLLALSAATGSLLARADHPAVESLVTASCRRVAGAAAQGACLDVGPAGS